MAGIDKRNRYNTTEGITGTKSIIVEAQEWKSWNRHQPNVLIQQEKIIFNWNLNFKKSLC